MMKEIYSRGPAACGIDANPLLNYNGGIVTTAGNYVDHIISVVGWGTDANVGKYWIVRNSWGEYWGEYGYVRVKFGALSLDSCDWATVEDYTAPEKSNYYSCHEGGDNCKSAQCKDLHPWCPLQGLFCKSWPSVRAQCKKTCGECDHQPGEFFAIFGPDALLSDFVQIMRAHALHTSDVFCHF